MTENVVLASLVIAASLAADVAPAGGWALAVKKENVTVYARERKETGMQELRAEGVIDAPPEKVWKVLREYDLYAKRMPYVEEVRTVGKERGGKVTYVYTILAMPLLNRRDYVLRLVDESRWSKGRGFLKISWSVDNSRAPQKPPDVVRMALNEGSWLLEPLAGGRSTRVVYSLHCDPGGGLPRWMANMGNGTAVPEVFAALRRNATSL
jgi:hypothetical protein